MSDSERPEPIVRADAMAHALFERRDVGEMSRFLKDFGLVEYPADGEISYFRGHGSAPWLVSVKAGAEDRFIGFGVVLRERADLEKLAAATGATIEPLHAPGGGEHVRLFDPDGVQVNAVFGAAPVEPLPTRSSALPVNTPWMRERVNAAVRSPTEPSPIFRFGHVVLQRTDFARSSEWYRHHFGMIPSDIQTLANGNAAMGFYRFDRGDEPADHHSVAILAGPAPAMLHLSFETCDLEALGQGHRYLRTKGWTPHWGIGRHALGSQLFDYWKDPTGAEWEHYADGDVMDAHQPTGYHELTRGSLWTWGDDLPASMRPGITVDDVPHIHAAGGFGAMDLESAKALIEALLVQPRPWMD